MPLSITLVRHARSEANAAGIWQGQGDAVLAPEGRDQARSLGDRLQGRRFDVVVSSDLARTTETAALSGHDDPQLLREWREMDLGTWEGRTFSDVAEEHPDLLEAIRAGEAVSFGGSGETIRDFEERALAAFDDLVERMGGEGSAIVFTHGGVIDSIVGRYFGRVRGKRTFPITTNTAMTVLESDPRRADGAIRLRSFNDSTHLGHDVGALGNFRESETPVAALIRHGVTDANMIGRFQGQQCWGLHPDGHDQALRLARWYGPLDRVISSPIQRALETAERLANGRAPEISDSLMEQSFGEWEGVRYEDLSESDQVVVRRIYADGEDLPRGRTGETFQQVADRMAAFLGSLVIDPRHRTAIVSHGAAIKALIGTILGTGVDIQQRLAVSPNTGISHVAFTDQGPMLLDYALAPHLEAM